MKLQNQILFVTNSLQSGGAEKQMLWIAESLVRLGWRVVVFEMVMPRDEARLRTLIEKARIAGVEFQRAPALQANIKAQLRLITVLRRYVFQAIWTWGSRADLLVYVPTLLGIRRGNWISSLRNANRDAVYSAKWLYRCINRHVRCFIGNTEANVRLLEEICPGISARCHYLPNMLEELERVRPLALPAARPTVWTLGMLGNIDIHRKGYDTAIEVSRILKARALPVRIMICGRPDQAPRLEEDIARNQLTDYIQYAGETTHPIAFLSRCEGYLLLSRFEGMPNAMLEAMSLGLPAIATKVGDLERMVGTPPAFALVDIDAPAKVVAQIERLLDDWPAAIEMGRRGRAWCEKHFSRASCEARLAELTQGFGPST